MTLVVFPLALAALALGVSRQRDVPNQESLPAPLQTPSWQGRVLWEQAIPSAPPLAARVRETSDQVGLELTFAQTPLIADGLVYWQAADAQNGSRMLLGGLQAGLVSRFALPAQSRRQAGRITIHSLARGEEVLAFAVPAADTDSAPGGTP